MHRKAAFRLRTLSYIRSSISEHCACRILKTMFYPYIDYANVVYTLSTDRNVTKLQRLLNQALRVVFRASRRSPVVDLHRKARIMSVKDRIKFNLLKYVHRQVAMQNSRYPFVTSRSTWAVEQKLIKLPRPRTTKFKRSPFYKSIQAWNAMDNDLRCISDHLIFKSRLKASFFSEAM